ncbi:MAG: FAD-dependent oxidoreductase [Candidatus Omnitrophica bacterium]|nr:FAD-dependent oxidoreductase [Candidatus Omnitrophota bacterium]
MKKVIIVGGGFAGRAVLSIIYGYRKKLDLEITLVNDKNESSFLPLLPDCLGRGVRTENLICDLTRLNIKGNFDFVRDKVVAIDLDKKVVATSALSLNYDFLIIASGSETNFYGREEIRRNVFKLDDANDAIAIRRALVKENYDFYLIAGGGYTGIEVATNLRLYLDKKGLKQRVIVVERASSILGPLPQWMKDYVISNLNKCNIEVLNNIVIDKTEESFVQLSDGSIFKNALLVWAAGVKTASFIENLRVEKNAQGRIKVDDYLRLDDSCFVVGDAALFAQNNNFLRMAVQFAIMQGDCVAKNIVRIIKGKPLTRYKPIDFGYIIPMANNKACGTILGMNIKGFFPIILHYFMCIFRSNGLKNKLGIIKDLLKGG